MSRGRIRVRSRWPKIGVSILKMDFLDVSKIVRRLPPSQHHTMDFFLIRTCVSKIQVMWFFARLVLNCKCIQTPHFINCLIIQSAVGKVRRRNNYSIQGIIYHKIIKVKLSKCIQNGYKCINLDLQWVHTVILVIHCVHNLVWKATPEL